MWFIGYNFSFITCLLLECKEIMQTSTWCTHSSLDHKIRKKKKFVHWSMFDDGCDYPTRWQVLIQHITSLKIKYMYVIKKAKWLPMHYMYQTIDWTQECPPMPFSGWNRAEATAFQQYKPAPLLCRSLLQERVLFLLRCNRLPVLLVLSISSCL